MTVPFVKPFENVPQVAFAATVWDFETKVPSGFTANVQTVNKKGLSPHTLPRVPQSTRIRRENTSFDHKIDLHVQIQLPRYR